MKKNKEDPDFGSLWIIGILGFNILIVGSILGFGLIILFLRWLISILM